MTKKIKLKKFNNNKKLYYIFFSNYLYSLFYIYLQNIKNEGNIKAHDTTILKGQSSSENFSINSSPETGHRKTSSDRHPDVLDLAGMDYSPAKRKPPIHN